MTDPPGSSLENFVRTVELPQRAKVTEGYYEPGDEDGNREFSNGEVVEVRRILCPLVDLNYTRAGGGGEGKVTVSTRADNVRYVVATRKEASATTKPVKPLVYGSVKQLVDSWPNMIRIVELKPDSGSSPGGDQAASKGDELRLIRLIHHDQNSGVQVEFKNLRTRKLVRLPVDRCGSFVEIPDPKPYSLRELVDMARVPRYLKIDRSSGAGEAAVHVHVQGLPPDYRGVLRMDKPQALVEIARVLQDESTDDEYLGDPLLVPVDCDIRLDVREAFYRPLTFETVPLARLGARHATRLPCVAFVVDWTEESEILYDHVTRPGDHVIVYGVDAVDKILAHSEKEGRYFLIPVGHRGRFTRTVRTGGRQAVDLKSLEASGSFPLQVRYSGSSEYSNVVDGRLPVDGDLTFDRYVAGDRCALVSKLFGDVIGAGFHLPLLRTRIAVRLEKRWRQTTQPPMTSHFDCWSEEIAGALYDEMMTPVDYELCPTAMTPAVPSLSCSSGRGVPSPLKPDSGGAKRPPPPIPFYQTVKKTPTPIEEYESDSSSSSSDDDAHDYTYIIFKQDVFPGGQGSTDDQDDTSNMEIPSNGNISDFTARQMVTFLRENHVSTEAVATFKSGGFDGKAFARMSDDQLTELGIVTPIIQFFRDRSRMQLVLHQL